MRRRCGKRSDSRPDSADATIVTAMAGSSARPATAALRFWCCWK